MLHGTNFTLDERYKLIDKSKIYILLFFSWSGSIWYSCSWIRLKGKRQSQKSSCSKKNRKSI